MKKYLMVVLLVVFAVSLMYTTAPAFTGSYTPGAGINDTVHDLRRTNTGLSYPAVPDDYLNRICVFCHAPHHAYRLNSAGTSGTGPLAPATYTYLPLWNHAVTTQAFTPYNNGPDQPTIGDKHAQSIDYFDAIGATSLLCLSCHDGTVAVNQYGHAPQDTRSISNGTSIIADQYRIGKDGYLANHHPIGFDYQSVSDADVEIIDPLVATFNSNPVAFYLAGGKMECSTCHAVHNKGNTGEKLLYISDANSNFCLTCHDKGTITPP